MIHKRIRKIIRSDRIVRTDHAEGKAFSADDWLLGVPVAGFMIGCALHGVLFQKMFSLVGSKYNPGTGSKYMVTGQWAVIEGIVWVALGLFASGHLIVFADNLSLRWRIIHFITSCMIAVYSFFYLSH